MSSHVEIFVKFAGPIQVLAHRVAEHLDATMYRYTGGSFVVPLNAERWIGSPGWAHLDVVPTEWDEDEDGVLPPEWASDTDDRPLAYLPYEYGLPLELRGPADRLVRMGRMIFDRLAGLGLPLAYQGIDTEILADFLPGRGVREFPPRVLPEQTDRAQWYEPQLHDDPAAPWRPEPPPPVAPAGRVMVFETGGLLQMVPLAEVDGEWRWATPMTWISAKSAREIGLQLGVALTSTGTTGRDDRPAIEATLVKADESIEDFGRRSVSVEVRSDGTAVAAIPHGPHRGAPDAPPTGPVIEELVRQESSADLDPAALGQLVLDLVAAVRERVPA